MLRGCCWLVVWFLAAAWTGASYADSSLRIGVAEVEITPPEGFPMAGYYHERLATGTKDPLKAKAVVLIGERDRAALVVCDLTGISIDLSTEVRRLAAEKTGIPSAHITVSATHSHTAPDYSRDLYEYLAIPADQRDETSPRYAARLIGGTVQAIVTAFERARPATVETATVRHERPVSFNRRFVMKDGSVRTWMRLDNPDVVRPAGPIDPELGVVLARDAQNRDPLGVFSSFALHLDTVGGTFWSADYPFFLEQAARGSLGPSVVSIFGTGCCGDINHVDPASKDRNPTDVIGKSLGETLASAWPKLNKVSSPQLRALQTTVQLPLQPVSAEQLARAQALLPAAKAGQPTEFFELVTAYKSIVLDQLRHRSPQVAAKDYISWGLTHTWAGVGEQLPVEVQVVTLGREMAIVCLPGEVFVELGLAIKQASPFPTTLVVELSNCVETVYIPTRTAYAGGSYEVTNSAVQPGAGEMLAEAAVRLLRDAASSLSK